MNTNISLTEQPAPVSTPQRKYPSRFLATLYLLVGMAILVGAGYIPASPIAGYFLGVAAEVALVIVAVIFLKFDKLPVRKTLRLNPVDWRNFAFALLMIPGVWLFSIVTNVILTLILGYTTPVAPSYYPQSFAEYVLFAFTAVIVAPICEEIVFRGYFQRAFERYSPWVGMVIGGLIFSMYHLRFQGMFALLPVAFAMSYIAWRSDSILVSMLMHAVFNSFATFFLILTGTAGLLVTGISVMLILVGAFVLLPGIPIAIWWVDKHGPLLPVRGEKRPRGFSLKRWAWIIPLLIFLGWFGYVSVNEVIMGRFPQLYAEDHLKFEAYETLPPDMEFEYEVRNFFNKSLGDISCVRQAKDDIIEVTCSGDVQASDVFEDFDYEFPKAFDVPTTLSTEAQAWTQTSIWSTDLSLESTTLKWESEDIESHLSTEHPDTFLTNDASGTVISESTSSVTDTLVIGEFPWRLQRIPLQVGYSANSRVLVRNNDDGTYNSYDALINVAGGEPVWTSLGQITAWKVTISYTDDAGDEQMLAVWYDAKQTDIPVMFSNGDADYVLKRVTPLETP